MSSISDNIKVIRQTLQKGVTLVAVSKTKPVALIREAYEAGQRIFGENRAQEMAEKAAQLPSDIEWHMIGHLQTNKVKYIAPAVSLVHSIDSISLLKEVNKRASQHNRTIDCLLQFHIARESTKYGLDLSEAHELLNSTAYTGMKNIRLRGVMGMASFVDDKAQVKTEFQALKGIFDDLKASYFAHVTHFDTLSMGMSGDYPIALEEGSTMVRVGSAIFGNRVRH